MKLNRPILISAFHVLFLLALVILSRNAAIGDWGNYYFGSSALMHSWVESVHPKIYDPVFFNNYAAANGGNHLFLSYTQVPPLSQLIYLPFIFIKIQYAKLIFVVLTYCICIFSLSGIFKKLQIDLRWSLLLPLLFLLPVKSNIDQGQSYFLLVALLAGGWLARENGKWIIAAFLFALAIHLKIFPAIVLIWFLAEKDWKMFGATVCAVGIFFIASLLFFDFEIWSYYGSEVLPRLAKGEITNTYATAYQSMQVFLKQLFVPDALHNPSAPFNSQFLFQYGNLLWLGIVLVAAFLFSLDKKQSSFLRFSVWIFAGMLISGYGSTYGLLFLIFPAVAIIHHQTLSRNKKFALLFLLAVIANFPVSWLLDISLPFSFLRLFLMIFFFAALIYMVRPKWNKFALFALFIPLLSLLNTKKQEVESSYFLKKEPSLLITLFYEDVAENKIQYYFWNEGGIQEGELNYPGQINYAEGVLDYGPHYINCKGKEYNFPNERIANPLLINGKTLLYLSDKNRGVGFYTIRKMEIR